MNPPCLAFRVQGLGFRVTPRKHVLWTVCCGKDLLKASSGVRGPSKFAAVVLNLGIASTGECFHLLAKLSPY